MLLIAALACGATGEVINKSGNPSKLPRHTVLLWGGIALGLWVVATVLLLLAIRSFNRARHRAERERQQEAGRRLAAEDVTQARRLAGQLLTGELPAVGRVWDVVLQAGERVLLDDTVAYSRYYGFGPRAADRHASAGAGADGAAAGASGLDHPVARAGTGRRAQSSAATAAAARWRDQQQCRAVVTDRRLLCQVQKGWISFDHAEVTAIRPGPQGRGVVLEYPGTAPICLTGPASAQITVIIVWALFGADGLREHPALAELRAAAPLPQVTTPPPAERLDNEAPTASISSLTATTEPPSTDSTPATAAPRADLLPFVAAHELVLPQHAALLLGVSERDAAERLEQLAERGLVSRIRLRPQSPTAFRITQQGADQVDAALPPLRPLELWGFGHAAAVTSLWLAARAGRFGTAREVLSARQMHAADAMLRSESLLNAPGASFRTKPPEPAQNGGAPSYPDLALLGQVPGWTALDVVHRIPAPEDLRALLGRANRDGLISRQRFFVLQEPVGELIERAAAELGLADRVDVQLMAADGVAAG